MCILSSYTAYQAVLGLFEDRLLELAQINSLPTSFDQGIQLLTPRVQLACHYGILWISGSTAISGMVLRA